MTVNILNATNSWELASPTETETDPTGANIIVSAPPQTGDFFILEDTTAMVAAGTPNRLTLESGLSYQTVFAYGPDNSISYLEDGPQYLFDYGQETHLTDMFPQGMVTIFGAQFDPTFSILDGPDPISQVTMTATPDGHGGTFLTRPGWTGTGLGASATIHLVDYATPLAIGRHLGI
jgi:hypothetical protein